MWKLKHQLEGREKVVRVDKVPVDNEKNWQNSVSVFCRIVWGLYSFVVVS